MNTFKALRLAIVVCAIVMGMKGALTESRADTFTLDPASPTLPLIGGTPGSLIWDLPPPLPTVGVPFAAMGLLAGDVVDAVSDGFDPTFLPHVDYFSVTRASFGAAGTGVFTESTAGDTPPGFTPGHAGDLFVAGLTIPPGTNVLAPAGFGWTLGTTTGDEANAGLITPTLPGIGDEVNAYDLATIPAGAPVLFSLAAGSPTLGILGAAPADILAVGGVFGPAPIVLLPGFVLGIPIGLDMDALATSFFMTGGFGPGTIEYSLTAASAAAVGLSGADILTYTGVPGIVVIHPFFTMGLLPTDDIDALDVSQQQVNFIPSPATLPMFLAGLGLLALGRLRRAI